MVALRKTMPSNGTDLYIAREKYPGVLPSEDTVAPGVNRFLKMEPNSYDDFGAEISLTARQPLSKDRQQKKGVVTGEESAGGFQNDFTMTEGVIEALSGFMFAEPRRKRGATATAVTGTGYTVAAGGAAYLAGDIVFVTGSPVGANNGLKVVGTGSTGTEIKVAGLTADANPVTIKHVGFQFVAGDASIDTAAFSFPALLTAAKDLTQLGLIPGEIVFVGGDGAANRFNDTKNSGWCRVKSVAEHAIYFDKTDFDMVDDIGTGKSLQVFFGDVLKNETGSDIVAKTYRVERSLGAPDLDAPLAIQGDALKAAMANELSISIPEKEIITLDFGFMAGDYVTLKSTDGLYPGTREVLKEQDAFNSSGDIKRERLAVYPAPGANTAAPAPLFALVQETNININNNATGVSAHKYVGFVEITEGMFEFSGDITAYFASIEACEAVRQNKDVTYDLALFKNNAGWALDMPMITLGNGRLELEPNEPIRIPLDMQASTGAKYDTNMNHTGLFVFFAYLPNLAGRRVD